MDGKKLFLNEISVKSFVTRLADGSQRRLLGAGGPFVIDTGEETGSGSGSAPTQKPVCPTEIIPTCPNTLATCIC